MEPIELYRQTADKSIGFKYARGNIGIFPNCFHEHFEIFFLLNGQVEYIGESVRKTLSAGHVVLIPPGVYHQFLIVGAVEPYERYVLEVSAEVAQAHKVPWQQQILPSCENSCIRAVFDRIYHDTDPLYREDFSVLLTAAAYELMIRLRYEPTVDEAADEIGMIDEPARSAMTYINTHLAYPLTATGIAGACFASVSSVSHAFQKNYGISLMHYVRKKKMALANRLLKAGTGAVETSRLCGYPEYSTFYRCYCREFGHAPTQ